MTIEVVTAPAGKLPLEHEVTEEGGNPAEPGKTDPLDSEEAERERRQIEDWYLESSDGLAECFAQMALDHSYYDHLQWSEQEKQEMLARGQAPLVFNKVALTIDWITGTERRTRVDFQVKAKRKEAVESASVKTKLLKYQSDTNLIGWNRSQSFKQAAIGGVGWLEASIRGDLSEELVLHDHVPYQQIRWDIFSRKLNLDDCRYIHRLKWMDLDYALTLFPNREDILRQSAKSHVVADEEFGGEMLDLPQPFRRYDSRGAEIVQRRWSGGMPIAGNSFRLRVPVRDTWFRAPRRIQRIWGVDLRGVRFDPNDAAMQDAVQKGYASLSDAVTEDIRSHIWVPGGSLFRGISPFKHGSFPYTPIWCKRRNDDGTPYGVIRGIRDAQDDYNKRRSKMLWLLSSNQMFHEESAIDPDKIDDVKRNLAKPNGVVELKDGALSGSKIKIERNIDLADAQAMLLEQDAAHIHDGSGVNREQLGRDTNATSGRAIYAKQQEGAVTTAELFDNLRLAVQLDGSKLLSLTEQFMTLPMQFRIAGDSAAGADDDWVDVNQPELVDGQWQLRNDISKSDADFVVDQIDFRESVRAAQAEQMFDMLKAMPPAVQLALLDIVVEMTDMPNRQQVADRIRKITGQSGPDDENNPEAIAAQQARAQADQQERQLQERERFAKLGIDEAKAEEMKARARKLLLDAKGQSLDIARLLEALLPLAPAADRLYHGTLPTENSNAAAVPAE